jgi:hypothetical protein
MTQRKQFQPTKSREVREITSKNAKEGDSMKNPFDLMGFERGLSEGERGQQLGSGEGRTRGWRRAT